MNAYTLYNHAVDALYLHVEGRERVKNKITRALNAEYAMGRYHAICDILDGLDFELFARAHSETSEYRDICFNDIEYLYTLKEVENA